jgi:hypothetical protein
MPPSSPKAPLQPTSASGGSVDWLQGQANQRSIGAEFLQCTKERNPELHAVWGDVWLDIPEEHACARALYEFLVSFLIFVYIIPKGRPSVGLPAHSGPIATRSIDPPARSQNSAVHTEKVGMVH